MFRNQLIKVRDILKIRTKYKDFTLCTMYLLMLRISLSLTEKGNTIINARIHAVEHLEQVQSRIIVNWTLYSSENQVFNPETIKSKFFKNMIATYRLCQYRYIDFTYKRTT